METAKPESKSMNSYILHPDYRFETQAVDENLFLLVRAHPFTQLGWIINSVALAFLLILLNFFFAYFLSTIQLIYLNAFVGAAIFSYAWYNFLSWYFNVGVITNHRIVDIDFYNILYKEVSEANVSKVEDVTSTVGGFFGSFFSFGNVFVQTAGTEKNIEFLNVPNPTDIVSLINDLIP